MESLNKNIENIICQVRGRKVILDRDLSNLLNIETRELNQKVKRNTLTKEELEKIAEVLDGTWKAEFEFPDGTII